MTPISQLSARDECEYQITCHSHDRLVHRIAKKIHGCLKRIWNLMCWWHYIQLYTVYIYIYTWIDINPHQRLHYNIPLCFFVIVQVSFQQSIALKFTIGNSTAILNGTKKQLANRKQSINTIWCFGPLQLLRCWHRRHGRRRFGTGPWRRFVWSQTTTTTVVQCFSYRFMYDLGAKYCCTLFPLYKVHINNIYIYIYSLPRLLLYHDQLLMLLILQHFGTVCTQTESHL